MREEDVDMTGVLGVNLPRKQKLILVPTVPAKELIDDEALA